MKKKYMNIHFYGYLFEMAISDKNRSYFFIWLGLVEASANLMPPSPAPSAVASTTASKQQQPPTTGAISKTNVVVPALLPPPQTSGRNSNRRSQYSSPPVRATTVEPTPVVTNSVIIPFFNHNKVHTYRKALEILRKKRHYWDLAPFRIRKDLVYKALIFFPQAKSTPTKRDTSLPRARTNKYAEVGHPAAGSLRVALPDEGHSKNR